MPIVLLMVIGAAAGYAACRLMQFHADLPTAMVVGMVGAVLGGALLRLLLASAGWVLMFVVALLAAMGLIWVWQKVEGRR